MLTLHVANRDYTEWTFIPDTDTEYDKEGNLTLSPLAAKLFHKDRLDQAGQLVVSPYRAKENICGVLLSSQKTYGRAISNNKLLYKCVPDDVHLPCFLVPYEERNIGFNKKLTDKYITFKIKEWTEKHPHGLITNTFGEVEDTEAYVAYRIACKEINDSLKILNAMSLRSLREKTLDPLPLYCDNIAIEDRRAFYIFSIDPAGCTDIDDALGISTLPNGQTILSIYIANVPMMLEYLQLWPYLTERVASIYLPDKKIPMLPVALSENLCSFREKTDRLAFVMDIVIPLAVGFRHPTTMDEIERAEAESLAITFTSTIIQVEKNYTYQAAELLAREDYKTLLKTVRNLNETHFAYNDQITSSHDVVEYCMLFMNHECAKKLESRKRGIFRTATQKSEHNNVSSCPAELRQIVQGVAGEYCSYANLSPHTLIGVSSYLHITSPIRRIVDIVNMLEMLGEKIKWSTEVIEFMEKWQKSLDTINIKTKAIRKLQNEMELLEDYAKNKQQIYTGIVFAKRLEENASAPDNASALYKYKVYIPDTKLLTTVKSSKNLNDYTTAHFSTHLFLDEAKMTKKIRLQML
jgi:exoribonuclease R